MSILSWMREMPVLVGGDQLSASGMSSSIASGPGKSSTSMHCALERECAEGAALGHDAHLVARGARRIRQLHVVGRRVVVGDGLHLELGRAHAGHEHVADRLGLRAFDAAIALDTDGEAAAIRIAERHARLGQLAVAFGVGDGPDHQLGLVAIGQLADHGRDRSGARAERRHFHRCRELHDEPALELREISAAARLRLRPPCWSVPPAPAREPAAPAAPEPRSNAAGPAGRVAGSVRAAALTALVELVPEPFGSSSPESHPESAASAPTTPSTHRARAANNPFRLIRTLTSVFSSPRCHQPRPTMREPSCARNRAAPFATQ